MAFRTSENYGTNMMPLRQWLIVKRRTMGAVHNVLILPDQKLGDALVGDVLSVGTGVEHKGKLRRLDIEPGHVVFYSSRVDVYRTKEGEFDVIEEGSVIGLLQ